MSCSSEYLQNQTSTLKLAETVEECDDLNRVY